MGSQTVRAGTVFVLVCCAARFGYSLGWQRGNFVARGEFDHRLSEITRETFTRLDHSLHAPPVRQVSVADDDRATP